ncbi:MAG TPA: hypothetical protein VEX62_09280 [Candidatus Limnocylindrales bacterium]|nr:hypothetical protein [Candidatus Limnocylindrales bacterium]
MIQRIIGGAVGALATWLILVWNNVDSALAVTAAVVGAVAAFLWPIIVGFFLARRVKQRRQDDIQAEVARQVAEQNKQG